MLRELGEAADGAGNVVNRRVKLMRNLAALLALPLSADYAPLTVSPEQQKQQTLQALLTSVRTAGEELPADWIGPSDLVLPSPDSSIHEVREVLGDEGLIPG